ncbi:molybdenum cofactor guanylyltransferase MobA [Acidocella sp.]|uniref:molybdenum cofactor guanylyltransferase MobA n=1 Tax=Acidocella sp. TaxID=50710 RepID=UPI002628A444|nr:molybdenum cofactor guanylyltransferase MobA [Acidocella sp.]
MTASIETLIQLRAATAGLILAGGGAVRLGGMDKGRLLVGGQSVLARVSATLRGQCAALALSANGDAGRFADLGMPVLADEVPGLGPLGGLLAGLDWAAAQGFAWLLTAPADTPFLPPDLLLRLGHAAREGGAPAAIAASGARTHGVVGLWAVAQAPRLRALLLEAGQRKVGAWAQACGAATATWPDEPVDLFFNINTPAEHEVAVHLAARRQPLSGAVVVARSEDGAPLLAAFAAEARARGARLGGLLQHGSKAGGDRPEDVTLVAQDTGEMFPILQRLGQGRGCMVDEQAVCGASAALRRARDGGLAPVLVNKFGPLEAEGLGLADDMLALMADGAALLTTVTESRLAAWLRFCGGACTLLAPEPAALEQWWQNWCAPLTEGEAAAGQATQSSW